MPETFNVIINPNHQFNLVREIQSVFGFYQFYFANLGFFPDRETCFNYCNSYFKAQFGYPRHNSFKSFMNGFKGESKSVEIEIEKPKDTKASLEREFLITHFKMCGFDTWTSFKAVVLHYFPEVTEVKLLEFWQNTAIDSHVLIRVNHVKQILG